MDVLAYEVFPQDVMDALQVRNWNDMDTTARCEAAHLLMPSWPSAPEILRGLEQLAERLAHEAMSKPRPDKRDRGDVEARTFIWYLGTDFHRMFGKALNGTLGKIADVTFNSLEADRQYTRSFVQTALKGV
jgi:hypothetical protein